jgi:uncharacterized protein YukE
MDGFVAPPKSDFDTFAGLMKAQAGHFGQLEAWAGNECSHASDLDGLLVLPVSYFAPKIASFFSQKLGQCQAGMTDVAGRAQTTGQNYASNEQNLVSSVQKIYPSAYPGFPDIGDIPGLQHLGNFTDTPVTLTEPDPAGDDTAKNIRIQLDSLMGSGGVEGVGGSGILSTANNIFQFLTGQNLMEILLKPLVGNYGRLKFLSESYAQLATGAYTVTGTVRKGSVHLGGEWQGAAATNFDSLMFRWSMGSGGIGDAASVASKAYLDGYHTICALVQAALRAIVALINNELKQLVETFGGDAAIETVGGGPEDPVADIVAGIWTMYKVYHIISEIISAIHIIEDIFRAISAAVQKLEGDVRKVIAFFSGPMPSISELEHDLINQVEQRGFEFEEDKGWNPELGAARIALLPSP